MAKVLGDMAASYVASASDLEQSRRTAQQLRESVASRIVIEQAKGMLASEYRISVDQAFALLRLGRPCSAAPAARPWRS